MKQIKEWYSPNVRNPDESGCYEVIREPYKPDQPYVGREAYYSKEENTWKIHERTSNPEFTIEMWAKEAAK